MKRLFLFALVCYATSTTCVSPRLKELARNVTLPVLGAGLLAYCHYHMYANGYRPVLVEHDPKNPMDYVQLTPAGAMPAAFWKWEKKAPNSMLLVDNNK